MSNAANIALTALQAFDRKSQIIANNIVNINTDRFKKNRANMEEVSPSGVKITIEQVNTPGDSVTIGETQRESSNVDLEEELIDLIVNRHNYSASIKTVNVADEMQGTLINILG
jgi:flagellar hook protein FlgE